PARGGSALGVAGVDGLAALPSALVGTYAYCEDALVERFHEGVDVSVVVLESDGGLRSLEPIAVEYEKGHEFDFSARYTAEFVSLNRPDLPEELIAHLGEVARQAHRTLGLRDVSRSDFIVSADGSFVVLETAITPGTTETSVFPYACTLSGTSLGAVARDLLALAIEAGPPVCPGCPRPRALPLDVPARLPDRVQRPIWRGRVPEDAPSRVVRNTTRCHRFTCL